MRSILSIIAGLIVGVFGVFLIKMINLSLYPIPIDLDVNDSSRVQSYTNALPYSAFILIVIAHIVGASVAAFIAGMVARTQRFYIGILTGSILLLFIIWKAYSIGQPTIINVIDISSTALAVLIGAKIGASRKVG